MKAGKNIVVYKKESTTMPSINYLRPISKMNFIKFDLQLPVRDFAQA
jgi:hypothetical protein